MRDAAPAAAAGTNSAATTLTLSASDAGSGLVDMRLSDDGVNYGLWVPFTTFALIYLGLSVAVIVVMRRFVRTTL